MLLLFSAYLHLHLMFDLKISSTQNKAGQMSRHISPVLDIIPGVKKAWTVLVQVVDGGHVQQTKMRNDSKESKERNEYRRLVLTDSEGTKFNALIYKNNLRYFACLFTPYKRYYISNALLSRTEPRYRISAYEYSLVLNTKTLVEELVESIPTTLPCQFEFTDFTDLFKYADREHLINVRATVMHCFPSQEHGSQNTRRRDVVIVNEEKKLMLLTLWNQFDEKEGNMIANMTESRPLIFGMSIKVTTFNSLSLTTRASSGIMINPPVTEDLKMNEWYKENKNELQGLLEKKSYKNTNLLLPYPKEEDIISVARAASSLNTTAWIRGKTSLPRQERSFWYTVCANCQKSIEADITWVVTCPSCRLESGVEAMSRITIKIEDGSGSILATICSPDAEKIMPFTAIELKEADEYSLDLHEDISNSIQQHTIVAFVRCYEATFNGQPQLNINVVKCYESEVVLRLPILDSLPTEDESKSISDVTNEATSSKEDVVTKLTTNKEEKVLNPSAPSKLVKRPLPFTTESPHSETPVTSVNTKSTILSVKKEVGIGDNAPHGSPIKKTKESSK